MPPYQHSGGRQCAVVNCKNNQKKLYKWENSPCQLHDGVYGKDCPCLKPFKLHCIPTSGVKRLQWLKSINRKDFDPSPKAVVCSKHFIDGRPTERNPAPVLEMGYQPCTSLTPGRRPLNRIQLEAKENTVTETDCQTVSTSATDVTMETDSTLSEYQFSASINLDDLIQSAIVDLCDPKKNVEAMAWEEELVKMQAQTKVVERRQREIGKLFSDCQTQLDSFKEKLEEKEKEDEKEIKAMEKTAFSAFQQPCEITIESSDEDSKEDDDDEVQFIQKTFDPDVASKRKNELQRQSGSAGGSDAGAQPSLSNQTRADLTAALTKAENQPAPRTLISVRRYPGGTLIRRVVSSDRDDSSSNINQMRKNLDSAIRQQLVRPASMVRMHPSFPPSSSTSSSHAMAGISPQSNAPPSSLQQQQQQQQKKPAGPQYTNSLANQERMEKMFLEDVNKIDTGSKVLCKKHLDLWEKAIVLEVLNQKRDVHERKYKVKYDSAKRGSNTKQLSSKQTAFRISINKPVTVGTRIVALYKDDSEEESFYAGIVAESPNGRNGLRYLVFFDDGYAQYCSSREIHKVFYQSKNVWDDIHPDSQDFVKDYLAQYPERPMVRLYKGQTVKTEWKGRWWMAKVEEVDASLVMMYFTADKRSEWIYRGSTRLEPLFTALANAEANRNAGKVKRHNVSTPSAKKPVVEYTRNTSTDAASLPAKTEPKGDVKPPEKQQKKAVARKSTTQQSSLHTGQVWEAPWLKKKNLPDKKPSLTPNQPDKYSTTTISRTKSASDMATVLQERLTTSEDAGSIDLESLGTRLDHLIPVKAKERRTFIPHTCQQACLGRYEDDLEKFKGNNPLLIPLFCGWERHVAKAKPSGRRNIFYRAPCGRRLRSLEEIDTYLALTDSQLPIDKFCSEIELHVHYEFIPVKTFCDIKDISYGKEKMPISCVNGIDRQYPDYVDYSNQRIPAPGVELNLDPNFLVCCDCTDNCRNKAKCACQQLTVEASAVTNGSKPDPDAGYNHRRLPEPLLSGVYECNSQCGCDQRCVNRVVQNGLSNRLQVFKTEKRGWGLRCLDDIPRGGFICIYAGQLLTDQGANEDGQQYGDEYLAELDYIEVVERQKEGYESGIEDTDEDIEKDGADEEFEESLASDSDESFSTKAQPGVEGKSHRTRASNRQQKQTAQKSTSNWVKSVNSSSDVEMEVDETSSKDNNKASDELQKDKEKKRRQGRSTAARYGSLLPGGKKDGKESEEKEKDSSFSGPSARDFFNDDQSCYIMDAKSMGNIGRYLNHSCFPCAFVQNVFVDTHDMRFPWVAFFAGQYISAGTELTWDYNYEVGSVPGKVLYCYCGSADCRGRLL